MAGNSTSPTEAFGGAFWSGEKLIANPSVVRGFDPAQVDVNAYNLRMGSVYFKTADESGAHQGKVTLAERQCFIIPPGQFAYLLTKEAIEVPENAMAFISMRTRIKYQGLINVSGFHVDPGYKGHLIYAVYNASPSPVQLCENDPAFKIWFCSLDGTSERPYLYSGKEISDIDNDLVRGMSREVLSLQSLSDKFRTLEADINKRFAEQKPTIDGLDSTWRNINFGIIAALVFAFLSFAAPAGWELGKVAFKFAYDHWPVNNSVTQNSGASSPP